MKGTRKNKNLKVLHRFCSHPTDHTSISDFYDNLFSFLFFLFIYLFSFFRLFSERSKDISIHYHVRLTVLHYYVQPLDKLCWRRPICSDFLFRVFTG